MRDFMTDATGDIIIKNGDFVTDESAEKHVQDILMASPGDYKQWPQVGVALVSKTDGGFTRAKLDQLKKQIKLQLNSDGIRANVINIKLTGNEIHSIEINNI